MFNHWASNKIALEQDKLPLYTPNAFGDGGQDLYEMYESSRSVIQRLQDWYSGRVFRRTTNLNKVEFPLAHNPYYIAVQKHVNIILGDLNDRTDPVINTKVYPKDSMEDASDKKKNHYKTISEFCDEVWRQSNGNAMLASALTDFVALGGFYIQVSYEPDNPFLDIPIRLKALNPATVIPIIAGDPWNLHSAYILTPITQRQAKDIYAVEIADDNGVVVEYWSRNEHRITVEGKVASRRIGSGIWEPIDEVNKFGVVPLVYIPRMRSTVAFYGIPLLFQSEGLLEEWNARLSDAGVAVLEETRKTYYGANMQSTSDPRPVTVGRHKVYNVGAKSLTGQGDPVIAAIEEGKVGEPTIKFLAELRDLLNQAYSTPAVTDGIDEGSQRSAMTMYFRFWPLASQAQRARLFISSGMRVVTEIILRMAYAKKDAHESLSEIRISQADFNSPKKYAWPPLLPRDREAESNIAMLYHREGLLSRRTIVEDSELYDPGEELRRIEEELEENSKREMDAKQPGDNEFGSSGLIEPEASIQID